MHIEQNNMLFQIEAIKSKEAIREFIDLLHFKRAYISYLAMAIFTIVYSITQQSPIIAVIIIAFLIPALLVGRHIQTKKAMKAVCLTRKDIPKEFYEETFTANGGTYQYEQITKIVAGKVCLYLVVGKIFTVMVNRDAFIIGDYESFLDFLMGKLENNPKAVKVLEKEKRKLS